MSRSDLVFLSLLPVSSLKKPPSMISVIPLFHRLENRPVETGDPVDKEREISEPRANSIGR